MVERSWLDPSGFVYGSLGEGQQAAAAPLPTQLACPVPGGQGVLAQLLFACTNARLFASLPPPSACLSLLTRQVWLGGGQAGVQDAWVSRSPARLYSLRPLAPCFASPVCPPPLSDVSSSFIKQVFIKCLCVFSNVFLCYVSGFGISVSFWLPSPQPPAFILSLEAHKREQSLAEAILSPLLSPVARNPPFPHFPALPPIPHDSVPLAA